MGRIGSPEAYVTEFIEGAIQKGHVPIECVLIFRIKITEYIVTRQKQDLRFLPLPRLSIINHQSYDQLTIIMAAGLLSKSLICKVVINRNGSPSIHDDIRHFIFINKMDFQQVSSKSNQIKSNE